MKTVELSPERHEAPACSSFGDERTVLRFEREVRVHRAYVERFAVTQLGDDAYVVKSASGSGGEYVVDVVDGALFDTCTCPDFLHNRLGTCKHIEAVRRLDSPSRRRSPASDVLTVRADGRLRIVRLGEARPDARVTHAALLAEKILRVRDEERRRRAAIEAALSSGELDVDVLRAPLFPYQRDGVAHLLRAGRAVLADDMGLGKTVQTIAACEVLRRRGEAKRIVVVCPASLKAQWASEVERYAGAGVVVIEGGAEERKGALASDAPYVIVNYELTWREELAADVLVLDEAQRARNFRTKTAAALKKIASRFLFVLTGTPVENKLDDLYGILQLVDPEVLGPLWKFNVDFQEQDESGKVIGTKNLDELRRRIAPWVLRRRKEEVLAQLPELTEQVRYVPLSREQADLEGSYRRIAASLAARAKSRPLTPAEQRRFQAALLKARQACNAARLCNPESAERGSAKLDELAALATEVAASGGKMLVFSEWREMLAMAEATLDAIGVGHVTLHGRIPTRKRAAVIDAFRAGEDKTVLLATDTGGVGLNLQVASYVVHLDLPWNPARVDQRVARAHRLGQVRGVSVTYLCAEEGIERDVEATLKDKRAVATDLFAERPRVEVDVDRANQRLRLAHVVLDAGYFGDAVRAAHEALVAIGMAERHADVARAAEGGETIAVETARAVIADAEEEVVRAEMLLRDRCGSRGRATRFRR